MYKTDKTACLSSGAHIITASNIQRQRHALGSCVLFVRWLSKPDLLSQLCRGLRQEDSKVKLNLD